MPGEDMQEAASILPLGVEGLGYAPEGLLLLEGISFAVPRGGITTVLGPNGAGKSLLLRLCHGLLTPDAGWIRWSRDNGATSGRKRHAMVFQRPVMLRRSAWANLDHALAAAGYSAGARQERISAALSRFGLAGLAGQPARLLSGGEQQRLAIARAWALEPEVIFLDEPCSQLDPGATRKIEEMLVALEGDGVTLIMATHDLGQARRLSRHVLFLNRGRLAESGPAEAFFAAPRTPEARAFLAGDLLW